MQFLCQHRTPEEDEKSVGMCVDKLHALLDGDLWELNRRMTPFVWVEQEHGCIALVFVSLHLYAHTQVSDDLTESIGGG